MVVRMFYSKYFSWEKPLRIFSLCVNNARSLLKQSYIPTSVTLQLLLTHHSFDFFHHLLFHCGVLCNQY